MSEDEVKATPATKWYYPTEDEEGAGWRDAVCEATDALGDFGPEIQADQQATMRAICDALTAARNSKASSRAAAKDAHPECDVVSGFYYDEFAVVAAALNFLVLDWEVMLAFARVYAAAQLYSDIEDLTGEDHDGYGAHLSGKVKAWLVGDKPSLGLGESEKPDEK